MRKTKKVLLIHKSFPAQFYHISRKLASDGHQVVALAMSPSKVDMSDVKIITYAIIRERLPSVNGETPIYQDVNTKLLRGESVAYTMLKLRSEGFYPDVVYAHPGWGEAEFVRSVFPKARLVLYGEWYYNDEGQEFGFDPEYPPTEYDYLKVKVKNLFLNQAISDADAIISPTEWQKSRFPKWAQEKISVMHEGIDYSVISLSNPKSIQYKGRTFALGDPIVTFATRYLEPLRGFHIFMRAVPIILSKRPDAHIFIMGMDTGRPEMPGYGPINPSGRTWKEEFRHLIEGYENNVHFMGFQKYPVYLTILGLSACHVYLTYPFVLSQSFIEVAAIGVPTVASNTAPVLEFVSKLANVVKLVDCLNHEEVAEAVVDVLSKRYPRNPSLIKEWDIKYTLKAVEKTLFGRKR